jgi:sulfur-carrier protein
MGDRDLIMSPSNHTLSSTKTIHLWGALRPFADGAFTVSIDARNIRELFRILIDRYPGMEPHIKRGVAVSIDGRIWRDEWERELPENAEIYLLPRIPGG